MEKRINKFNILIYFTLAVSGAYISVYQNAIPDITSEFGVNSVIIGLVISLHFIGSILFPAVFGWVSDHIGETIVTLIAFGVLLCGLLLIVLSGTAFLFATGILLAGGGFAVIEGTLSGLIARNNQDKASKIMSLSQMYFCMGAAIGPFLRIPLSVFSLNWRAPYYLVIVLYIVCWITFKHFQVGLVSKENTVSTEIHLGKLFNSKVLMAFLIAMSLYVGVEEGVVFWVGDLLKQRADVSRFISVYWVGMLLGRFIYSRVNKGQVRFCLYGIAVSSGFTLLAILSDSLSVLFISYFFIGFGFAPVWPFLIVEVVKPFPKTPNTVIGAMMSAAAVGGSGMPAIMGVAVERFGGTFGFSLMLVAVIIVVVILFRLFGKITI